MAGPRRSCVLLVLAVVALHCVPAATMRPLNFTPAELCEEINLVTGWSDKVVCEVEGLPGGHLISVFEGSWANASYAQCDSYVIMPGQNLWSQEARGALYLFALIYTFLGIAIVADVFMNAIEVITSKEIEREVTGPDGKKEMVKEKYWNDTIANLSLMALGSSAPEILLSVIGVVTALPPEPADVLGPGTIVGSAAYNLLFITAICIIAPSPRITRVDQYGVFLITAFFAVEAYLWLLIIIDFNTPEVIDIWEAVVTVLHFPTMLLLAYGQDRNWQFANLNRIIPEGENDHHEGKSNYLAFRRNAVRFFTGGKRVLFKGTDHKTHNTAEVEMEPIPKGVMTSDPYTVLRLGKETFRTAWVKKNCNPSWNETFVFEDVEDLADTLMVDVYDHDDLSSDDLVGCAEVSLNTLSEGVEMDHWLSLKPNKRGKGYAQGEVRLTTHLTKAPSALRITVVQARDLPGLDKQNRYLDAMASHLGERIRKLKRAVSRHQDIWADMKVDWMLQFKDALMPAGEKDERGNDLEPSGIDLFMHFMTIFWKAFFACIPPVNYYGGWLSFYFALAFIGLVTAVVGELASTFGCIVGLKDSVTAITFVALGTSLPDTFASKVAASESHNADSAIGNVTGSNAVNVFLGIGIPWSIAAIYADAGNKGPYISYSCGFGLSVATYCICALCAVLILTLRRRFCKGELGGDPMLAKICAVMLISMWFIYVIVSSLRAYDHIGDIWTVNSDAPIKGTCP